MTKRAGKRYEVRLTPTSVQWLFAVALGTAAWLILYRVVTRDYPRPELIEPGAGMILYLLEIGYLVFLRSQYSTIEVDAAEVRFLKARLPRAGLRVELLDWYRFGARGAVVVLHSMAGTVRLGVRARSSQVAGGTWGCDAVISRSDADDLLFCLDPAGSPRFPELVSASAPRRAPALRGIAPWLLTIVLLGVFGVTMGVYFPSLPATPGGRLFLFTVVMGGVAAGLVTTTSGWHERTGTFRPTEQETQAAALIPRVKGEGGTGRPTFARSAFNMSTWTVASMLIAALIIAPVIGVNHVFREYVDIPACTAHCEAGGTTFASYRSSKQGSFCTCRGQEGGLSTIRVSYNVTGGRGFVPGLVDFVVRATAYIGGTLLWIAGFFALAVAVKSRLPRNSER